MNGTGLVSQALQTALGVMLLLVAGCRTPSSTDVMNAPVGMSDFRDKVLITSGGSVTEDQIIYDPISRVFKQAITCGHHPIQLNSAKILEFSSKAVYTYDLRANTCRQLARTNVDHGLDFSVTLLPTGEILLVSEKGAELLHLSTSVFRTTVSMLRPRSYFTTTPLRNGKVLFAGGDTGSDLLASAELYDPERAQFIATHDMFEKRWGHTATLLNDGRVLIVGGACDADTCVSQMAEVYDPTAGRFVPGGTLTTARSSHTATLLADGKVLVAGGTERIRTGPLRIRRLASAELYDPTTGTFWPTTSLAQPRSQHQAVLLGNGDVLIIGGIGQEHLLDTAELYHPSSETLTSLGNIGVRFCCDTGIKAIRLQ